MTQDVDAARRPGVPYRPGHPQGTVTDQAEVSPDSKPSVKSMTKPERHTD